MRRKFRSENNKVKIKQNQLFIYNDFYWILSFYFYAMCNSRTLSDDTEISCHWSGHHETCTYLSLYENHRATSKVSTIYHLHGNKSTLRHIPRYVCGKYYVHVMSSYASIYRYVSGAGNRGCGSITERADRLSYELWTKIYRRWRTIAILSSLSFIKYNPADQNSMKIVDLKRTPYSHIMLSPSHTAFLIRTLLPVVSHRWIFTIF